MASIGICNDTSESTLLNEQQSLYLKPVAKLNVSVQLPQLKSPGTSISNWEVMEKVKKMVKPEIFLTLKVAKSTLDFVRFEGEIENKGKIKALIQRLDSRTIKLAGFPDALKVRSAEARISFPQRHDWDSYFRDAKNMNEMKPGERPDTIHFRDLPCRWFADLKSPNKDTPSEAVLKQVFEVYGEIRCIDIPMLDPYRKEMGVATPAGSIQTFSNFIQDITFEAFVQYKDYVGFCKAMTTLRGMKLLHKELDKDGNESRAFTAAVKVDFDRTKHLSDKYIRKRRLERESLMQLEKEREERVRKEREEEERKREEERRKQQEIEAEKERKRLEKIQIREERQKAREEKRRMRRLEKKKKEEEKKMKMRIALEERRILIAQRKLETIRLLSELFNRIKVIKQKEEVERRERELEEERKRQMEEQKKQQLEAEKKKLEMEKKRAARLETQEKDLREKILKNMKVMEERKNEKMREDLRKKISGKTRLKSAVVMRQHIKQLENNQMDIG